jgi:DNA-binding NtrC family response regulator
VVDDETSMQDFLGILLQRAGHEVVTCGTATQAVLALEGDEYDLVISDIRMPEMSGLELLERVRDLCPETPIILITAHGTAESAVEAMKHGAYDYLTKPFSVDEIRLVVEKALEKRSLASENRRLRQPAATPAPLSIALGSSPQMQAVLELVRQVAPSRTNVLITGESGTGKELIARALHYHSDRVGQPFVAVNCRALAPGVLESELFGHERGAFTGAERARPGLFERADGGTLFLDEIGDTGADFQAKLLRVLQERSVVRVGGDDERSVDVRIVAATNRDLRAEVAAGRFREDLFFRLAVIPVQLPPLRERPEDVLPLAAHFLERARQRLGREVRGFSPEAERLLATRRWPGNVRELENAVERGVVLARGPLIEPDDLLLEADPGADAPESGGDDLQAFLDRATREHLERALAAAGGKRIEAARALGIDRTTLYRLMRRHDLSD